MDLELIEDGIIILDWILDHKEPGPDQEETIQELKAELEDMILEKLKCPGCGYKISKLEYQNLGQCVKCEDQARVI